jgi:hypothetical protein
MVVVTTSGGRTGGKQRSSNAEDGIDEWLYIYIYLVHVCWCCFGTEIVMRREWAGGEGERGEESSKKKRARRGEREGGGRGRKEEEERSTCPPIKYMVSPTVAGMAWFSGRGSWCGKG